MALPKKLHSHLLQLGACFAALALPVWAGAAELTPRQAEERVAALKLPACFAGGAKPLLTCASDQAVGVNDDNGRTQFACRPKRSNAGDFVRVGGVGLMMHQDNPQALEYAAQYLQGKKYGRVFTFSEGGQLEGIDDYDNDKMHGMRVECSPQGRPTSLSFRQMGQTVGVSLIWEDDGKLMTAGEYGSDGRRNGIERTRLKSLLDAVPNDICRPKMCDLNAAAKFSLQ